MSVNKTALLVEDGTPCTGAGVMDAPDMRTTERSVIMQWCQVTAQFVKQSSETSLESALKKNILHGSLLIKVQK